MLQHRQDEPGRVWQALWLEKTKETEQKVSYQQGPEFMQENTREEKSTRRVLETCRRSPLNVLNCTDNHMGVTELPG